MKSLLAAMVLLAAWSLLPGCDARATDKEDIQAVWDRLTQCNDARDGTGVLEVFTANTFEHYDKLVKIGLDATRDEVRALGPSDMEEVLRMRTLATRAQLQNLSGKEYVRFATGSGWYLTPPDMKGESPLERFVFNKARDQATAWPTHEGEVVGYRLRFVKEGDQWRFDEAHAFGEYDRIIRAAARDEGVSVPEFVAQSLAETFKRPVPDSSWDPMPK